MLVICQIQAGYASFCKHFASILTHFVLKHENWKGELAENIDGWTRVWVVSLLEKLKCIGTHKIWFYNFPAGFTVYTIFLNFDRIITVCYNYRLRINILNCYWMWEEEREKVPQQFPGEL